MLEIGIIIIIVIFVLALQIVRIGANSDFRMAIEKCRKCKNYTGHNVKYRLIYCNGCSITPEEVSKCNTFQEKKKDKE